MNVISDAGRRVGASVVVNGARGRVTAFYEPMYGQPASYTVRFPGTDHLGRGELRLTPAQLDRALSLERASLEVSV